ncbi:MAG TPA: hypothetical protein VES19_01630 [Candidatus Limnocylindrales bacterium]|nr:hypothetical protein [Candidatus Limnocylindrales bacterium]
MTRRRATAAAQRRVGFMAAILAAMTLVGGCDVLSMPTPLPSPRASAEPDALATLSPAAAAIPRLRLELAGRVEMLSGYDPSWPASAAADRRLVFSLAPRFQLERGVTYDIALSYQAADPVLGWLPPDFGLVGGSAPARTTDGFVTDRPTSAFVRADALPDFEAGLFGVRVETRSGTRIHAYPIWVEEMDAIAPDAFSGLLVGVSDEDGATAALTFVAHLREDLARGGGPEPLMYPTRADVVGAFEAGDLDAYIAIPKGWSDLPTTRNGFEARSSDPVTGNGATDTGDSYKLSSLIVRGLGPGGLIINRGY